MQCLGASGACHMGAVFLKLHYEPFKSGQPGKVYIPSETWGETFTFLCEQDQDSG